MAANDLESIDVDELITAALALDDDDEQDDEHYWVLVSELQRRGDQETFEAARDLCGHEAEAARILGVSILGQLGYADGRPFAARSVSLLTALCDAGQPVDVLVASIRALGLLGDPTGAPAVFAQAGHPDEDVRLAVAQSAEGVAGAPAGDTALAAILLLMGDASPEVRGWATFCLGSQLVADAPDLRQALHGRLADPVGDAAGEALVGLARRRDPGVTALVAARLEGSADGLDPLVAEAAARTADPALLPALRTLRSAGESADGWLAAAIETCEGGPLREPG